MSDYLITGNNKLISCEACFEMQKSMTDVANDKWFLTMAFGAERWRRREETDA